MRVLISGTTLLVVGLLVGGVIGPEVRAEGSETGRSASVAHTAPTTAARTTPTPTREPAPAPTREATAPLAADARAVPGADPKLDPNQPITVALGDSITFNPGSWFRQICSGSTVVQNCLNSGIRGNTTKQMMARLDSDALDYKPAIFILMGGTNDLKRRETTKKIMSRLDIMIDRAQRAGATTVLCTIPPRNRYGLQVLSLNRAIRKYAARNDVPLLDFYNLLGTRSGIYKRGLTRDGIHPNLRAADLMRAQAEQQLPALLHPIKDAEPAGS